MEITNIHQAKTHLSKLIERARRGEDVIIGKAGRPVARLVAYDQDTRPRTGGLWRGKVKISEQFDQLPDDMAAAFRGEGP
jgi:prevent-host-death family protein